MARMSREERAELRAQEMAEVKDIQSGFKINTDDLFSRIMTGNRGPTAAEMRRSQSQFIDTQADRRFGVNNPETPSVEHMDWDNNFLARLGYQPPAREQQPDPRQMAPSAVAGMPLPPYLQRRFAQQGIAPSYGGQQNRISLNLSNRVNAKAIDEFAPVVNVLKTFKFANDDNDRQEQLNKIAKTVQSALEKLAMEEVASNTQKFYNNLSQFFITETGVQAIFKHAEKKIAVHADGIFTGDEIICLEISDTEAEGGVARRIANTNDFDVITSQYKIRLEELS